MHKQTLSVFNLVLLVISTTLALTSKSYAAENAKTVSVDTKKSSLSWVGKKVLGQHTGKIKMASGYIVVKDGNFITGQFVIDMTTISNDDLKDPSYKKKLITHLSSTDFFNVAEYPTATATITKVQKLQTNNYSVTADFTIKGITKSVSFPATLKAVGSGYKGNANITLDRTLWDIRYGSSSFFEGIGDKAIKNEFELKVNIVSE